MKTLLATMIECLFNLKSIHKKLDTILESTKSLKEQGVKMATKFDELVAEMNAATNQIAARIDALIAKITAGGMTAAEEDAVHAELAAVSARLKELGADPAEPIPPVE